MKGKKYIYVCAYGGLPVQGYTSLRAACEECGFGYWHVFRKMKGIGSYVRGEQGIYTILAAFSEGAGPEEVKKEKGPL